MTPRLLHAELSGGLLGGFYEVFRELRGGFREAIYREALIVALRQRDIPALREQPVDVYFRDTLVGQSRIDLLVGGVIVVECKTARAIAPAHEAQLLHYLHATRLQVGFILNFGEVPSFRRMLYDPRSPSTPKISDAW